MRETLAILGLPSTKYAQLSLRIGGATFLSAERARPEVVQRKGVYMSCAYKGHAQTLVEEMHNQVHA